MFDQNNALRNKNNIGGDEDGEEIIFSWRVRNDIISSRSRRQCRAASAWREPPQKTSAAQRSVRARVNRREWSVGDEHGANDNRHQ